MVAEGMVVEGMVAEKRLGVEGMVAEKRLGVEDWHVSVLQNLNCSLLHRPASPRWMELQDVPT